MTSYDVLRKLIEKRYPEKAFANFFELNEGTGWKSGRAADLVTMSLWPSRGLHLIGHEVKISRSDWKRELDNPAKADPILRFCREWYLVVSDRKFIHEGELPATWGLIEVADKVTVLKTAPARDAEPPTWAFFASLCRAAQNDSILAAYKHECETKVRKADREGFERGLETGREAAEKFKEDALKWRRVFDYFNRPWDKLTVEEVIRGLKWFYSKPNNLRKRVKDGIESFEKARVTAENGKHALEQVLYQLDEEERRVMEESAKV